MKNGLLALIIVLLFTTYSNGQAPSIQWEQTYGGPNGDAAFSIIKTSDGGYAAAGSTGQNGGQVTTFYGFDDYWIVKLNSNDSLLLQKSLGGTGYDVAVSLIQTRDGGYIIAGISNSNDLDVTGNHGGEDYWIVKIDSIGDLQWEKSLGGSSYDAAYSIIQTTDNGYAVAGWTTSYDGDVTGNHGGFDYWVVKLDSSGNMQWQKTFGGTSDDEAYSIIQTADGGYAVAGYSKSNDDDVTGHHGDTTAYDYWVVKINDTGAIQWEVSLGGSDDDRAFSIIQASDKGYMIAGSSYSTDGDVTGNHGSADYWVVKLDSAGVKQWQGSYGGTDDEVAWSVMQTIDGGYAISGYSHSDNEEVTGHHGDTTTYDYWVIKINDTGVMQWQKSLGGSNDDVSYSIIQTTDSGYAIAGASGSTDGDVTGNHGNSDFWIVKLDANPSGISDLSGADNFRLYPNPAKEYVEVEVLNYDFMQPFCFTLYDLVGKKILNERIFQSRTLINRNALASGFYTWQIHNSSGLIKAGGKLVWE